jgi:transposase-like protein
MADPSKKGGTIACPRCKAPMEEVVRIAPAQNEPRLIGYECPSCSRDGLPAVLDSFSHFPHINTHLVHISRVVGRHRHGD